MSNLRQKRNSERFKYLHEKKKTFIRFCRFKLLYLRTDTKKEKERTFSDIFLVFNCGKFIDNIQSKICVVGHLNTRYIDYILKGVKTVCHL